MSVFGPWEVQSVLARGGMGVVNRVRHRQTGATGALKTVRQDAPASARFALRREVAALAGVTHPAVVALLDHDLSDAPPWFVMQLLPGESLADLLGRDDPTLGSADPTWPRAPEPGPRELPTRPHLRGPAASPEATVRFDLDTPLPAPTAALPPRRPRRRWDPQTVARLALVAQVAHALAHLHASGLVHCDLKPANLVVDGGRATIVDFGLVTRRGARTDPETISQAAQVAGTASYMSPERARGEEFDARADLYALGCLLVEVVSGAPPFPQPSAPQVLHAHLFETPAPLSARVDGVPAPLEELVAQLLQKDPRRRPGHARQVLHVLAEVGVEVPSWPLPAGAPLYQPRMRGRRHAVARLRAGLGAAAAGDGRAMWLAGEGGIGKTRLARALVGGRDHGATVLVGGCTAVQVAGMPQPSGIPLQPFLGPLAALADRAAADPALARALRPAAAVLHPFCPQLAVTTGAEPAPSLDRVEASRARLLRALADALDLAAGDGLLLLVLDDLQWADELSIDALRHLIHHIRGRPRLVLGLLRSDEIDGHVAPLLADGEVVPLRALESDDVTAMIGEMLGQPDPEPALVGWVQRHAAGNPFFVGECLRVAVDERFLTLDPTGRWRFDAIRAPDLLARPLPERLAAVIGARLALLTDDARAVGAATALIGRSAPLDLLAEVVGLSPEGFDAAIDELERRVIARIEGDVPRVHLVHDRLVEQLCALPDTEASSIHCAVAGALGRREAAGEPVEAAQLAWHQERGGLPGAGETWARAANVALARLALGEAEEALRAAIRLAATPVSAAERRHTLAHQVLLLQGRAPEALTLVEEALTALDPRSAHGLEARATHGHLLGRLGRTPEAREVLSAASTEAKEVGERAIAAHIAGELAQVHLVTGSSDGARRLLRDALDLLGDDAPLVRCRLTMRLGITYQLESRFSEAVELLDAAVAQAAALGNPSAQASALGALGTALAFMGRAEVALARYDEAIALQRRLGNRASEGHLLGNQASVLHRLGRIDEATRLNHLALAIHRDGGNRRAEGITLRSLATALVEQGRLEEALQHLDDAEAALSEVGERLWLGNVASLRTRVLRYLRRFEGSATAATQAVEAFERLKARTELGDALLQQLQLQLATGRDPSQTLARIQALVAEVSPPPGSILDRAGRDAERLVAAAARGEPMVVGERIADLSDALASRLRSPPR